MMQTRQLLLLLLILFSWSSCKSDNTSATPEITGQWELTEAKRNGRQTESLGDLHFVFGPDGSFTSNLSGEDETGTYELNEGIITTDGISMALTYRIDALTDSTLVLKSNFGNYRFDFQLRRASDDLDQTS